MMDCGIEHRFKGITSRFSRLKPEKTHAARDREIYRNPL
jgi:hypothetical protein